MEDISIFLRAIGPSANLEPNTLASFIDFYNPKQVVDLEDYDIAILTVADKGDLEDNSTKGAFEIRRQLYSLYMEEPKIKVLDLGYVMSGHDEGDTVFAVETICRTLIGRRVVPLIIGESQSLTLAMYKSFAFLERMVNMVSVDPKLDIGDSESPLSGDNYLSKIILEEPNFMFNYSQIGYQSYLVSPDILKMLRQMFFDLHRLGEVRSNVKNIEPVLRGADLLSFDLTSVRSSDFYANKDSQVNGMSAEDACQLFYYSGMSDKISAVGIFGYDNSLDHGSHSAQLIAQMIWFFIDGFRARNKDSFIYDKDAFTKYMVSIDKDNEIVFYKSKRTDRWWMEVPYPRKQSDRYNRSEMVPCSYSDYEQAGVGIVPDRWLSTYNKLG